MKNVTDFTDVFVYGTLKEGHGNHRLLAGRSVFMGIDTIKAKLFDLGPYPFIKEGDDLVYGEIYRVGPQTLASLDRLEGHPTFYERRQVKTSGGAEVWVYYLKDRMPKCIYLPEGVWPRKVA